MPMSPQVRAVRMSPRRTVSGPSVSFTYLAMLPCGPKTWPISSPLASMPALVENGYLSARLCEKGWNTCAFQTLFSSVCAGCIATA
ncbi:hypothetical protein D3C73_798900 [compost metagenome]